MLLLADIIEARDPYTGGHVCALGHAGDLNHIVGHAVWKYSSGAFLKHRFWLR